METLTVDYKMVEWLSMMLDFDNQGHQYRDITIKEFKDKLEKTTGKKIRWKNKPKK